MAPPVLPHPVAPAPPSSAREPLGAPGAGQYSVDGFLYQTYARRRTPKAPVGRPVSAKRPASAKRPSSAGNAGVRAAMAASYGEFSKPAELQQLLAAIEREYATELHKIDHDWVIQKADFSHKALKQRKALDLGAQQHVQPPSQLSEALGLPPEILGAMFAGKCRDQRIPATKERQRRFGEFMLEHCAGTAFWMPDCCLGPECAKAIMLALTLREKYTVLNLAGNKLSDAGAASVGLALAKHRTLQEVNLSANDISHKGANFIFEALKHNTSVQKLDLSSRCGALRNSLVARHNAEPLEEVLTMNKTLSKLMLAATGLGADGAAGLARGLVSNTTLLVLDLSQCEIGCKGAVCIAEALRCCCLEELNLSENRLGDDGLSAIASCIGALPTSLETKAAVAIWQDSDAPKALAKYLEAVNALKRAFQEFTLTDMQARDDRNMNLQRVNEAAAYLATAVRGADLKPPKLKVLQLANCGGTAAGTSRLEDALQVNRSLETLVLDHSNHRDESDGARSLLVSLPPNPKLRHLSLANSKLGTNGFITLAKVICTGHQVLRSLNLSGNAVDEEAAEALGAALGCNKGLRHINFHCCHMDDPAAINLVAGLAFNQSVETLILRDNNLHEAAALAMIDVLQRNTTLTQLCLELNSIDMRQLLKIKLLLSRNQRIRENDLPNRYRIRIEQLKECEKQVETLAKLLERNHLRKRQALWKQAAKVQELRDARELSKLRQQQAEEKLQDLTATQGKVEEEIMALENKLRVMRAEGDYEISQLNMRLRGVEGKMESCSQNLDRARKGLGKFEAEASVELASLREELLSAQKGESSSATLAAAAQRNLDSFAASLKAIGEDLAGGDNPRQRVIRASEQDARGRTSAKKSARPRTGK